MTDYSVKKSDDSLTYNVYVEDLNNETNLNLIGFNYFKYGDVLQQNVLNLSTNFYTLCVNKSTNEITEIKTKMIPGQVLYDGFKLWLKKNSSIVELDLKSINIAPTGVLTLTGDTHVGNTLTLNKSALVDLDGLLQAVYTYAWYRGSTLITGETQDHYATVAGDVGQSITCKVSYTDDKGTAESVTSSAITVEAAVVGPPVIPGGIPASNAAWGGAGYGGTANYTGGYSAAGGHNGNGGGGSASPVGGNGGNWLSATGSDGTYGTGGSGGGYSWAGVAGTGLLPGYDAVAINATGIGNGGGGIETDNMNQTLTQVRGGNGTGGLIRITINAGSYSFTPADLTTFSGTRIITGDKAIEWDNSSGLKTAVDPYDHALIGQFTVPAGVTKIDIGVIGGGGGGAIGPCVNAGGGGGGATLYTGYAVIPGTVYTIKVGAGGQGGLQGAPRGPSAGGAPPYGVTEVPWRGGKSAFCSSTGTELIFATGGNTRPDNCAALTNADSATAGVADVPGPNVVAPTPPTPPATNIPTFDWTFNNVVAGTPHFDNSTLTINSTDVITSDITWYWYEGGLSTGVTETTLLSSLADPHTASKSYAHPDRLPNTSYSCYVTFTTATRASQGYDIHRTSPQ
jgi:hypothetical protein